MFSFEVVMYSKWYIQAVRYPFSTITPLQSAPGMKTVPDRFCMDLPGGVEWAEHALHGAAWAIIT